MNNYFLFHIVFAKKNHITSYPYVCRHVSVSESHHIKNNNQKCYYIFMDKLLVLRINQKKKKVNMAHFTLFMGKNYVVSCNLENKNKVH
jgi:hypothetical protein